VFEKIKRKYFFVIIFLILAIFLTDCNGGGIVTPSTTTVPENGGMDEYDPIFVNLLEELDTPKKICDYMEENFTYKNHDGKWTPYELYLSEWGDCGDFATFGCYFAHYHGYETYFIRAWYSDDLSHGIAVYVYENGHYEFSSNTEYFYHDCSYTGWSVPIGSDSWHKICCLSIEDVVEIFSTKIHNIIRYEVNPWNYFDYRTIVGNRKNWMSLFN